MDENVWLELKTWHNEMFGNLSAEKYEHWEQQTNRNGITGSEVVVRWKSNPYLVSENREKGSKRTFFI